MTGRRWCSWPERSDSGRGVRSTVGERADSTPHEEDFLMKRHSTLMRTGAITGLLALTLTACGSDGDDTGDDPANGGDANNEETQDDTEGEAAGGEGGTITLGIIPSWTDGLSTAYLWKNVLESEGYTVEIAEIADAAPLYTGV